MRAGLANVNGRLVRALYARLGILPGAPADLAHGQTEGAGPHIVIEDFREEPWASLTFSGTTHRVDLRLEGFSEEVTRTVGALSCWSETPDPMLSGHFLAEVQVTETARELCEGGRMSLCLRLDALTIEE